jgi:hypothetical protein
MGTYPQLELIWRTPTRAIERKLIGWWRARTNQALAEYMEDYLELVSSGYHPKGYTYVPIPHCARVHRQGMVLAEWHLSPGISTESRVTVLVPQAGEASPQQYPSPAKTTSLNKAVSRLKRSSNAYGSPAKGTQVGSGSGIPAA